MDERNRTTILLADEFGLVREGLAMLCESGGAYRVCFQCGDGVTALSEIEARRPDIAILDLNLPRLFSLEIVRKVKECGFPTRTVILSQKADRKLVLEALRNGASGFLPKSASTLMLFETLSQIALGGIYFSPEFEIEKLFLSQRNTENTDPLDSLSSREYQVFSLLVDGIRAKEIAARLDLSPKTVDTYRASLMRKLDIYDVAGLVKFAIHRDLTSVS
jgi:DNA-binding NarL/FixJ family response regulator